jgi:ankyrin repeat protein
MRAPAYEKFTKEIVLSVKARGKMEDSALIKAIHSGKLLSVKEVLASDEDLLNVRTGDLRFTPLQVAAGKEGGEEIVKALLEAGAPVNALDNTGNVAFHHLCCKHDSFEMAKLLIEAGTLVDHRNRGGYTPLHLAIKYKRGQLTKALFEADADCNIKSEQGLTAYDCLLMHRTLSGNQITGFDGFIVKPTLRARTTVPTAHELTAQRREREAAEKAEKAAKTVEEAAKATQAVPVA